MTCDDVVVPFQVDDYTRLAPHGRARRHRARAASTPTRSPTFKAQRREPWRPATLPGQAPAASRDRRRAAERRTGRDRPPSSTPVWRASPPAARRPSAGLACALGHGAVRAGRGRTTMPGKLAADRRLDIAARGASWAAAAAAVDAVLDEITTARGGGAGHAHRLRDVRGHRTRRAHGRNPRTGEALEVAATTVARFHPGAPLRARVAAGSGSRSEPLRTRPPCRV